MRKLLILFTIMLFMSTLTCYAETELKENSFRYKDGLPIETDIGCEHEQPSFSLFSTENTLRGIDVSTFQGDIDWEQVKNSGINFAIIRCGYGDDLEKYDDAKWKRNADECTRLGIPFGAYLYSYAASIEEAQSEVAHAIRLLKDYNLSYPIYLDLEDTKTTATCTNDMIGQIADIFCTALQNEGYEVGIYANLDWWNTRLTSNVFENPSWHKWIAQWAPACTYNGTYDIWQYSGHGSVPGISGEVDLDYMYVQIEPEPTDDPYPNTYQNTGDLRKDIVGVAKTQIGYEELTTANGTPVGDSETPYYTKYGAAYGNPNGHWCAFFVLWCAKQAGIPTSIICQSPSCGSCSYFINWLKSNHCWKDKSYIPQYGDLIFFDWEQDGSCDHVGIVQGVSGSTIYTIEGNTGGVNGYKVMERDRNDFVYGYGVPNYELIEKINGYGNKTQTAYMLPDSSSQTIWEIWENDELQVLCRDGNYYLVLYPFEYTGKFIAAYVPTDAVNLDKPVPLSESYYNILSNGIINKDTTVYHNASEDDIQGSGSNHKVRTTLNKNDNVEVLFEDGDFVFVRTDKITGYVLRSSVSYENPESLLGDINGDGVADAGDAGMILRYDVGLISLTEEQIKKGDVNGDNVTDAGDAGVILRKDAGLIK